MGVMVCVLFGVGCVWGWVCGMGCVCVCVNGVGVSWCCLFESLQVLSNFTYFGRKVKANQLKSRVTDQQYQLVAKRSKESSK